MSIYYYPWINDKTRLFYTRSDTFHPFYVGAVSGGFEFGKEVKMGEEGYTLVFPGSKCTLHFPLPDSIWLLSLMPKDRVLIQYGICKDPSLFHSEDTILDVLVEDVIVREITDMVITVSEAVKAVFATVHFLCIAKMIIRDGYESWPV